MRTLTGIIAALFVSSAAWAPPPAPSPPWGEPGIIDGQVIDPLWMGHVESVRAEIGRQREAAFEALEEEMRQPVEGMPSPGSRITLRMLSEDPSWGYLAGFTGVCGWRIPNPAAPEPECLWRARFVSASDAYERANQIGRESFDPQAAVAWLQERDIHATYEDAWQYAPYGAESAIEAVASEAVETFVTDSAECPQIAEAIATLSERLANGTGTILGSLTPPPPPHAPLMRVEIDRAVAGNALTNMSISGYSGSVAQEIHALLINALEACHPDLLR